MLVPIFAYLLASWYLGPFFDNLLLKKCFLAFKFPFSKELNLLTYLKHHHWVYHGYCFRFLLRCCHLGIGDLFLQKLLAFSNGFSTLCFRNIIFDKIFQKFESKLWWWDYHLGFQTCGSYHYWCLIYIFRKSIIIYIASLITW